MCAESTRESTLAPRALLYQDERWPAVLVAGFVLAATRLPKTSHEAICDMHLLYTTYCLCTRGFHCI
jgi:hypothetical protein